MSNAKFKAAQAFDIRFGKYKGRTIDDIASSDEGLMYLDWLRGQAWLKDPLKSHLATYLSDPTIKKELDTIT